MTLSRSSLRLVAAAWLFALCTLLLTAVTHGLSPSLIEADEGAHYVNALFLGDWIRAGFPSPLAFARDFYAHFPRLTIGHWPPGWYALEAPFFALFRPSPLNAAYVSAALAGLPGIASVWAFSRLGRPALGVALGVAYTALPLVVDTARYLLVDQPLSLAVALAAIAWASAAERPSWARMLTFALIAAACPLIKGNDALIALVPALDIAITGRSRLLREPALWGAAAITLVIVAPWYWLSFRISSEGFNYDPGLPYAWLALRENAGVMLANLGTAGLLLAILGAANLVRRDLTPERRIGSLSVAIVIATLLFQSAIPASLAPRYVAPLLPWLMVLAGLGLIALGRHGVRGRALATVLGLATLWPSARFLAMLPPKPDLGAPALAETMRASGGLWLVDGRSGAEGALIAAAAHADAGRRRIWVARASQWLSTSDFMGRGYRLTAADPAAAGRMLDRLGAAGAVSVALHHRLEFPHSPILLAALNRNEYHVVRTQFARGDGTVVSAIRLRPVRPNVQLIATDPGSAKVATMTGALR